MALNKYNQVDHYLSNYPASAGTGLKKMVSMFVGKIVRQKIVYSHRMAGTKNVQLILCGTDNIINSLNNINRKALAEVILIHNIQGYSNNKDCVAAFHNKSIHDITFLNLLERLVDYAVITQSLLYLEEMQATNSVLRRVYIGTSFMDSHTGEYAECCSKYRALKKRIMGWN